MIEKGLWRESMGSRRYLFATFGAAGATALTIIMQAYLLSRIVSGVFLGGQALGTVLPLFYLLAIVVTARAVLSYCEERWALALAQKVQQGLRQQVLDKIQRLGPVRLLEEKSGELLNLLLEGVETLHSYFGKYLPQLIKTALVPVLFLLVIFPQDWPSGLILLLTAPLLPLFMMLIGRWSQAATRKQWRVLSRMAAYFQDVIAGLSTLKQFNVSQKETARIASTSEDFRKTSLQVLRIAFLSAFAMEFFSTISIALVAVGLGLRLVEGRMDYGAALFILLLAPEFYQPIRNLGSHYHASLNGVAASKRIFSFLQEPEDTGLPLTTKTASGLGSEPLTVCLERVSYCYPQQEQPALTDVTFTLESGERVALVGQSGGGKTTLLQLLLGFLTPTAGQITVCGTPLSNLNLQDWRRQVAYVPQHPYIFAATLRENLTLGDSSITEAAVRDACEQLGLNKLLSTLPSGLETVLGEGGRALSGGQKQLVAVARAYLQQPKLILLDEATANLDLHTEEQLQSALNRLLEGRSVIAAAHRLKSVADADLVLVLENGRVVQQGKPAALAVSEGAYRALLQAGGAKE